MNRQIGVFENAIRIFIVVLSVFALFITSTGCNREATESVNNSSYVSSAVSDTSTDIVSSDAATSLVNNAESIATSKSAAKSSAVSSPSVVTSATSSKSTAKPTAPSLTVYPVPEGLDEEVIGVMHSVKVNGKNSFVYRSEVTVGANYQSGYAEYTSFDFSGSVTVEVTANYAVSSIEILPSRDNIKFTRSNNVIKFTLTNQGQYFIKINGDTSNGNTAPNPLYIFANPPEENVPDKNDPNVVYFEPGVYYHQVYYLESNKIYYFAPGAFVYGRFYGHGIKNVTMRGRGTICGQELTSLGDDGRIVCIKDAENISVEGIQLMHPKVWTIAFYQSQKIRVDNIKTISHGMSSDGIDICGSSDAVVKNSFFRAHDDILAVKSSTMSDYTTKAGCFNIKFQNCVVWCDSSNPMTIGYETVGDVTNVLYENIDVLNQSKSPVWKLEAIMAIEPHYTGTVDGITYRDIRIDIKLSDDPESLFRFVIDDGSGTIKNIRVENVFVNYGGAMTGTIKGRTIMTGVNDITFVNVRNSAGDKLNKNNITTNLYVSDVTVD